MLQNIILYFGYFVCVISSATASLVPFIKPCKLNDNDCLVAANIQIALPYLADGIPELGIKASEPMVFENITMGQEYFKFVLPHFNVFGFKKCRLVDFKSNQKASTIKITLDCPMKATGDYEFSGKICIFDIDKKGDFKFETDTMRTTITIKTDVTVGPDSKKYWNLTNYDYAYDAVRSVHVDLAGLFAGDVSEALPFLSVVDEELGNGLLKIGEPIASNIVKYFVDVLKTFFLRVPLDQIAYY